MKIATPEIKSDLRAEKRKLPSFPAASNGLGRTGHDQFALKNAF